MAQPATNPKIEELRFRLKTDPKSRLFYQLAEELRRGGQFAEAEQVLRQGLVVYPTYLAAWVSLGRVLREQKNDDGAVEALNKALTLDPGNMVAARILADAYLTLGDKVEAIKKYKLVYALLPSDEELRATIERLELELHPPAVSAFAMPDDDEVEDKAPLSSDEGGAEVFAFSDASAVAEAPTVEAPIPTAPPIEERDAFIDDSPFDKTTPPFTLDDSREQAAGDDEPMLRAHDESPFEDPAPSAIADALEIESPVGIHVEFAPTAAEVATPSVEMPPTDLDESDVFAPVAASAPEPPQQQLTDTLTMADLYARQGLIDDAKTIYEHILARDPENAQVREKLAALSPPPLPPPPPPVVEVEAPQATTTKVGNGKVERLERWLSKVSKREVNRV